MFDKDKLASLAGAAKALAVFGVSRLLVLMGCAFSWRYFKPFPEARWSIAAPWWWSNLVRFDSAFYINIAASGYAYNGNAHEAHTVVFFPGYPILIRAAAWILHISIPFSAFFVANACSAGAVVLLFWLVARKWDEQIALATVAILSFFPSSLFLSAAYAEGAGLLFTVAAFFFLFRGQVALAALSAGCLSATGLGFVLAIPLLYGAWQQSDGRFSLRPQAEPLQWGPR